MYVVRKMANRQVEEGRWRWCWQTKRWTVRCRSVEDSANMSGFVTLQFLDVVLGQLPCGTYFEELT